jgi:hypothetical protein
MELTAHYVATFNNTTTKIKVVTPQGGGHTCGSGADDHNIEVFSFKLHSGKSECTLFVIGTIVPMPFFVTDGNWETRDRRCLILPKPSFFNLLHG